MQFQTGLSIEILWRANPLYKDRGNSTLKYRIILVTLVVYEKIWIVQNGAQHNKGFPPSVTLNILNCTRSKAHVHSEHQEHNAFELISLLQT
jgi:hypothetical protein